MCLQVWREEKCNQHRGEGEEAIVESHTLNSSSHNARVPSREALDCNCSVEDSDNLQVQLSPQILSLSRLQPATAPFFLPVNSVNGIYQVDQVKKLEMKTFVL